MNGAAKVSSRHSRIVLLSAATLVAAIACREYAHANPYDPAVPVTIVISGPDSIFSLNEQASFTAATMPIFPDSAIEWASSDTFQLTPAGRGTFKLSAPVLYPLTRTVYVEALIGHLDTVRTIGSPPVSVPDVTWRHKQTRAVVLTQRVVRIALRCPNTNACDTMSVGGTWSAWVDGFDALGFKIYSLTSATANPTTGTPIATFSTRDPTIASVVPVGIRASTVTALKTGTTWIIATRGLLLDSLRLVVR